MEELEDRRLLATVTVGNLLDVVNGDASSIANLIASDGGDGVSLREAITAANNTTGGDTIDFSVTGVINIGSQLPTITDDLVIDGQGAFDLTIDAGLGGDFLKNGNGYRIFNIDDGTGGQINVELNRLTLQGGDPGSGASGGAVSSSENLTLKQSIVTGNASPSRGGGVNNNYGTLDIDSTLLSENWALYGGAVASYGGTTTITNSTLSGNSADFGGAIANTGFGGGTVDIQHSTITGNNANSGGGGIYNTSFVTLGHTLLSGNTSSTNFGVEIENFGGVTLDDYNLLGHSGLTTAGALGVGLSPGATDITATSNGTRPTELAVIVNPEIFNNGGMTPTHSLPDGSPAANAGDPAFTAPPEFDQRGAGFPRVFTGRIDIGAFESPTEEPSLIVDLKNDVVDAFDMFTSLREAIIFANSQPGADTITFDPSVFTGGTNSLIRLTQGELEITGTLTIDGTTSVDVVITGDSLGNDVTLPGFITDLEDTSETDLEDNSRVLNSRANSGDLTLNSLTITGGNVSSRGGGIFTFGSNVMLTDSTVSGNRGGNGGGIYTSSGAVTLTRSTISGNSAIIAGGGIRTRFGMVMLSHSAVSGNTSGQLGGGIFTRSGTVMLSHSTLSGNSTMSSAGGIYTLDSAVTIDHSTISGNTANSGAGGGIVTGYGAVTLTRSTVNRNTSGQNGGGIWTSFGAVTIDQSTISGNTAGRSGGGIRTHYGNFTLTSSTISGNMAGRSGGGVSVFDGASNPSFTVDNSIISDNTDDGTAPDLQPDSGSTLTINSSLIGVADFGLTLDQQAAITNGIGNHTGTAADPIDPLLGPLADNSGPTQTHALLPGSPALGIGSSGETSDQRGLARNVNGVDIGAYEAQIAPSADFDSDGDVDGSDFLTWQRGFGIDDAVRTDGNSDDDTDVDASDLAAWQVSFGEPQLLIATVSDQPAAVSSQAYEPTRTELIDAAIAFATLEYQPEESPEVMVESDFLEVIFGASDPADYRNLTAGQISDHEHVVVDSAKVENHDQSWLDEPLLERVFG